MLHPCFSPDACHSNHDLALASAHVCCEKESDSRSVSHAMRAVLTSGSGEGLDESPVMPTATKATGQEPLMVMASFM